MNMVEFGYFFASFLMAMVAAVHGYRIFNAQRAFRTDAGPATAAPSGGYI